MSGVWVFRNGVARLVSNPMEESLDGNETETAGSSKRKVLVYTPSNEIITSYSCLESKLVYLGWERYIKNGHDCPEVLQYQKKGSRDLITLPRDFSKFKSIHMYDIVVKSRFVFEVRDLSPS